MEVGIFGFGFVGQALAGICNNQPSIYDPKFKDIHGSVFKSDMRKCDIVFICVNTPSFKDGQIDSASIMEILNYLDENEYRGLVVIKSTIIFAHISDFLSKSKLRILINPEFLQQNSSFEDAANQASILIGCNNILDAKVLKSFYQEETSLKFNNKDIHFEICSLREASDFKYIKNIYNATLVTFWEMVHNTTGGNSRKMAKLLDIFPSSSKMNQVGMDGERGFGGACLPKDTLAWGYFHDDKFVNMLVEYNEDIQEENV